MVKRREFLGLLTAVGGSYVLSACGGGGGGAGDGKATSAGVTTSATSGSAGSATTGTAGTGNRGTTAGTGNTGSTQTNGTSAGSNGKNGASNSGTPASADGTSIPPAASIVDNQAAVWTVVSGSVYRNSVKAGNTYNVSLLLWYGGVVYHQGTGGQFYGWSGSAWYACGDPRLGVTSADGTTIPNASYIIDKAGAIWTVASGVVLRNNVAVGATSNVSLLLWYGGKVWYRAAGGQFYVCNDVDQWLPCADPRIPVAAASGTFHGINGHYDYRYTPAQVVSIMQNMGCSTYRVGVTDDSTQLAAVVALAQAFQSAGLTLFVLIQIGMRDANGALLANESAAYNRGHSCGVTVAGALAPYGVVMYECGNELTRDPAIILDSTNAGTKAVDFSNANWPIMRGLMRGMMDGVKAAQPAAKCGINFCVADIGAADALWDGTQPDGTSGYPTVRWDMTTWHNYEVYGDIFDIGSDGSGPGFDLPTYCKARYGMPFLLTEWNTGPEKTLAYRADYISSRYASYYQARKTKNIQSTMYYELDSGNTTYGLMIDGVTVNLTYNAFVSAVASHPDN
ncbi:hypothetical protein [Paraburkholderia phenoliruptrix]|uniref:Uncharacterized protein n=2 Tax=Paraburkholderia phenoliruptrix TaxID=252970 RepID=K0E170_9BURK|nr:hypothetical protein [Paraburkholderia phenoliruptrix]AFT89424.1 hypothetical protein BUPH_05664 [Paraburkholderia phenoliruptrix BR3459a]MDR6421919.1 hypothetical protein [Paraburkholderia phenoliruptrix]CAB4050633.1 hypothetical protein LMG9964_04300 [Paraburkholderia phenoliruptrix]